MIVSVFVLKYRFIRICIVKNIQQKTGKHFAFLFSVGHPGLEPGTSRL